MPDEEKTKVVIIGAGAAGVFTAYLLKKWAPDCFDIKILEKNSEVGGHTISYPLLKEGEQVNIDGGAQFFSETAQPDYCKMLQGEGFFGSSSPIIERDVGVTVWSKTNGRLLFRIPSTLPEILSSAVADPLNWLNFLSLTDQAIEQHFWGDWSQTFGDWLDTVPLLISDADAETFKANIARPLMYQFGLVPPSQLGSLSARFVVYYYVVSLPWSGGAAPFKVYNSTIGLDGILECLLAKYGLTVNLNSEVASIARNGAGYVVTLGDGSTLPADDVVFAINPECILPLLPADTDFDGVKDVLNGMEYVTVPVDIQYTDAPKYMPAQLHRSVSNVLVLNDSGGDPTNYMLSVWFGPLRTQSVAAKYFKSWGSPALVPPGPGSQEFIQTHHLMVGTPDFIARRETLRSAHHGKHHLWYAGGYIVDYDSQEACLRSATFVANDLIYNCKLARGGPPKASILADWNVPEALAAAEFKNRPALLEAIEREIVARRPDHPAVRAWLERRGREPT